MFADCEIELRTPYEVAAARLVRALDPNAWHAVSESAYELGLEAELRVGPLGAARGLSKLVRVQALPPAVRDGITFVPLRWEATGALGELFPALDADLIVSADGEDQSKLRLVGSYRPPLGRAGAVLDRAIMHRVATATLRALLREVAALITAQPEPDPSEREPVDSPR